MPLGFNVNSLSSSQPSSNSESVPSPGGDGTHGKTTNDIVNLLRAARDILQRPKKPVFNSFNPGDLVYSTKHEEHGVVLGEMPIDTGKGLVEQWTHKVTHPYRRSSTTYIVLTLSHKDESEELGFRIRYANSGLLKLVEECVPSDESGWTQLRKFCSNQCIQDCTSECALYKFKQK